MRSAIRGMLFDLGSTLWQRLPEESWRPLENEANARSGALLSEYAAGAGGVPLGPMESSGAIAARDPSSLGAALRQVTGLAISAAHQVAPDEEPDFALVCQQAAETLLDLPIDLALGARAFEALRIRLAESRLLFSDALPTLRMLRERGYAIGVATNRPHGGEPLLEDLRRLGLMSLFTPEAIAVSANLGVRKPNPALFEYALAGLRLGPAEIVMIGDNMVADIWGAQRLGACAIWRSSPIRLHPVQSEQEPSDAQLVLRAQQKACVYDPRTESMAPPDAVIHCLADLLDIFPPVS